jgi:Zn-dependent protease with chaperone function
MEALYPVGPAHFPESLVKASNAYRRQAWVAMLALLAFAAFYLALGGWFGWKAYSLLRAALHGARDSGWLFFGGCAAAFITVFMAKALVFIKRGEQGKAVEITAKEQPALFAFLYRLADDAKAPRPRKVYVSARVNAAVFYDLSPLNLVLPSRKNLEIGLALVNVLSLSEFKAVLAHEFGHFAQRSMAVGRWVYVAQQIAAHVVAKRDGLDRFLTGLSNFDLRVAWIGWLLSLVVWSIRSVVDTFFRLVLAAERALSREMEFQADRISVSLTGSDALINALYKCQAADQAWDRTLAFADAEAGRARATVDLFEVQSLIIERLRAILDEPAFGVPPRASGDAAKHRIFKPDMVQGTRMWATHPFNHEREENAKRHYLAAEPHEAPAWDLFEEAKALKTRMCADMVSHIDPPLAVASREDTLAALELEYGRESYKRIYRGCYLSRAITRRAAQAEDLYLADTAASPAGETYTASLSADLKELEALQNESAQLVALHEGVAKASGGTIQVRGKPIPPKLLPAAIARLRTDIERMEQRLVDHDRLCRTSARRLATAHGRGWDAYLLGLLRLVHYAEHVQAHVLDAQGALANAVVMVTAKRKVNQHEVDRVLSHAGDLYGLLSEIDSERGNLHPDAGTLALLGHADWSTALGEWKLGAPSRENISNWLDVIDGWARPIVGALGKLRRAALDQLLVAEGRLGRAAYEGQSLGDAPAAPAVPTTYRSFLPGSERPLQKKLDWWSRFQTADGWVPGTVRLIAAGGIIGALMGMSGSLGTSQLAVHNGLARPVVAQVGRQTVTVAPGSTGRISLDIDGAVQVIARTPQGQLIESFKEHPDIIGAQYVYNVAAASPMYEWTAVYGNATAPQERLLGAQRWFMTSVDAVLEAPPKQIQTKGGGGTRRVLSAPEQLSMRAVLGMANDQATRDRLVGIHARWDAENSPYIVDWLGMASLLPGYEALLRARLADNPLDVATLRMEQDQASSEARGTVCGRHRALAAEQPQQADLQYLAVRCMPEGPQRDAAFKAGHAAHPGSGWFAYAAAHSLAAEGDRAAAAKAYSVALKAPPLADQAAVELARLRRIDQGVQASLQDLLDKSETLRMHHALETGTGMQPGEPASVYFELEKGRLTQVGQLLNAAGKSAPRALRLAAASDGAPQEWVERSLALPATEGIDQEVMWSAIGLAVRHARSLDALEARITGLPAEQAAPIRQFIEIMKTSRDVEQAEKAVQGLTPHLKAHAYVMGAVALGPRAPAHWKDFARRALFAGERPYLT